MYLAIGMWVSDEGQLFTLSRETESEDAHVVADMLRIEGKDFDNLNTILLVKEFCNSSGVLHHWSAENEDF